MSLTSKLHSHGTSIGHPTLTDQACPTVMSNPLVHTCGRPWDIYWTSHSSLQAPSCPIHLYGMSMGCCPVKWASNHVPKSSSRVEGSDTVELNLIHCMLKPEIKPEIKLEMLTWPHPVPQAWVCIAYRHIKLLLCTISDKLQISFYWGIPPWGIPWGIPWNFLDHF